MTISLKNSKQEYKNDTYNKIFCTIIICRQRSVHKHIVKVVQSQKVFTLPQISKNSCQIISSRLPLRLCSSVSFLWMFASISLVSLSRSETISCAILRSPSFVLLSLSIFCLSFFSFSTQPSRSSRVPSSLPLTLFR